MTDWRGLLKNYLIVTAVFKSQAIIWFGHKHCAGGKTNKLNKVELRKTVNVLNSILGRDMILRCCWIGLGNINVDNCWFNIIDL